MRGKLLKWCSLFMVVIYLAACGGGGSGVPPTPPPAPGGQGIAVDPYIVGAKFAEYANYGEADERELQVSGLSGTDGVFVFPNPFTAGSTLVMIEKGVHNGIPYTGTIKRQISSSDVGTTAVVASPLTTLAVEFSPAEVTEILNSLGLTPTDLYKDPMVSFNAGDTKLVVAAMAVNVALTARAHSTTPTTVADIQTIIASVKAVLETTFATEVAGATVQDKLNAAVAISENLAQKADDGAPINTIITIINDQITKIEVIIDDLIEGSKNTGGAPVVVDEDEQGNVTPGQPKTVGQYLDEAFAAFNTAIESGSVVEMLVAIEKFRAAATLALATDSEDKDAALFFGAFARVLALLSPNATPGTALNNLGDILDGFGYKGEVESFKVFTPSPECETFLCRDDFEFGATSPTGAQLQAFLVQKLGVELTTAISMLNQVSTSFQYTWDDPTDQTETQFDYGDALFVRSIAQAMLAGVSFQQAYDLNVDIQAEVAKGDAARGNFEVSYTAQDFLAANPNLGKLKANQQTLLNTSKSQLSTSADSILQAMDVIKGREGDAIHFIDFYTERCEFVGNQLVCTENTAQKIAEFQLYVQEFKAALNNNTSATLPNGMVVNISRLFAGLDLRALAPSFTGNTPGLFPDPTLGGVLVGGFNINEDLNESGTPDILESLKQSLRNSDLFPTADPVQ